MTSSFLVPRGALGAKFGVIVNLVPRACDPNCVNKLFDY